MNSKVFIAVLSGLGAGMVVGMLFAPDKGAATRQKIADKAHDLSDQLHSVTETALDKINQLGETARATYEQLTQEVEK